VYITQVMPSPTEPGLDIVRQYQADMGGNGIGYTSLEGYVNAVALVEALKKAGPDLTRAKLLAALETLNVDAGGVKLAFSATRHQGSSQVYLTRVAGGKAVQREAMD
jgi:branched-chain amino acid transport system substrate-binding protein